MADKLMIHNEDGGRIETNPDGFMVCAACKEVFKIPTTEELLIKKYPRLFAQSTLPMNQTAMCWGLQCGPGWYGIIDEMCKRLDALNMGVEFSTIKEKYGTLRVYCNGTNDEVDDIIRWACRASAVTCEECGNEGRLNDGGWLSVRCKDCRRQEDASYGD